MTDAKNQQAEPSMEEILASIRRIISEDTDTGKAQPAAAPAPAASAAPPPPPPPAQPKASEPAPAPKAAEPPPPPAPEVLELTEMVGDDGNVTDLGDDKPSDPPAAKPVEQAPVDEDERLVSQRAASAAAGALSGLQAATRRPETPRGLMGLGNAGMTLEEIVRAEMRPILKAWLDEHLPPLVERLVQREIKRITRQVDE
jgi:uncharacterized protein